MNFFFFLGESISIMILIIRMASLKIVGPIIYKSPSIRRKSVEQNSRPK